MPKKTNNILKVKSTRYPKTHQSNIKITNRTPEATTNSHRKHPRKLTEHSKRNLQQETLKRAQSNVEIENAQKN